MSVVLDASALLAWLQSEPGCEKVDTVLGAAVISAVNWAEVMQKSLSGGVEADELRQDLEAVGLTIADFTASQAEHAARLWARTSKYGLSLADRACLALGAALELPVLTTDRQWKRIRLDIDVQVLR